MATDNKQPHEYPYPSWYHSLHAYSRASDDLRRQAELMRQRGKAIRIESDALAKYYQLDVNNRLRDRIQCNREFVHMLRDLLNAIISVTQTLGDIKIQADQFLANLNDAMTVNVESLTHRDTRRDGDYVLDDVQEHLRREAQLQKEIRDELQGIIDDAVVHLKALVAIRREAEEAIANKKETIEIDVGVHNANEKSANIGFKPFRTRNVSNYLELQTYEDLFRDLLSRGEECVAKARALCEQLYDALNRATNRLRQKAEDVSQRLRRRIFETSSALRELRYQQVELERMKEKLLMDIAEWQSSRASKVAQQKLSETRTEERTKRPGLENAKDAVYYGLNEEHSHLVEVIDALDEQIVKAREQLQMVEDRLGEVCERMRVLNRSLAVDRQVFGLRCRL
ncbi:tektin 2 [Echinococcus multilocularis]|uniref:Tektin n=1 Tax=Echinococcus multilocularis TaxID=6211 RepID=A0A068YMV6_ECHMU|nr:tektin 2 [Echinococcus multilocularis]